MSTLGRAEVTAGPDPSLLTLIKDHGGRRGAQAVTAIATAQLLAPHAKKAWARARRRDVFTIAVPGTDDIYPDLHEWVLERLPEDDRKALIASSGSSFGHAILVSDSTEEEPSPRLRLRYDGQRQHTIRIKGHTITVNVSRDEMPGRDRLPDNWRQLTETITFTASNAAGRDAVVAMLEQLLVTKHSRKGPPPLLVPSRWGGSWNRRSDLPPRTLESVILKAGQLERLVDDLGTFLGAEAEYGRLSQPWHRGYLFHGPPGTGKTSVARALANHFDMPVYYLPLGDLERDADLMGLVGAIRPLSMLLLEDVDVFQAATDRSAENQKTSVAAMLNALDGVWTPHGLVTVMTTNHRESLDPALYRAGRVDVEEELDELDPEQAERLAAWLGVDDGSRFVGSDPATMIQCCRAGQQEPA